MSYLLRNETKEEPASKTLMSLAKHHITLRVSPMTNNDGSNACEVLVVDDDPIIREMVAGVLYRMGVANIDTAGNGTEALTILAKRGNRINLLITDLMMPDKDGIELFFAVSDTPFHGKVVILSGAHSILFETAKMYADRRGIEVIGMLKKPLFAEQLRTMLEECRTSTSPIGSEAHASSSRHH